VAGASCALGRPARLARAISSQGPRSVQIDGELVVGDTRTSLPLELTLQAPADVAIRLRRATS
jgi:hypothetical protein